MMRRNLLGVYFVTAMRTDVEEVLQNTIFDPQQADFLGRSVFSRSNG